MNFMKTEGWKGYSIKQGRGGETEVHSYEDKLTNSSSQRAGKLIAGQIDLGSVTFHFSEDASVAAIRQKCIDMAELGSMVFEDVQSDRDGTIIRRLTLKKVVVIDVKTTVDETGGGLVKVTVHAQYAKWERLTPDGTYAEAVYNPNGLAA